MKSNPRHTMNQPQGPMDQLWISNLY
jgi:hypothetical protein